jgi:hypothetical protein
VRTDAGTDGGSEPDGGPPPAFTCAVAAQDCDGGQSCLYVQGGPTTACRAGACDLLRQDCADGELCGYRTDDAGVTARACLPAGSAEEGEPCPTRESPNGCAKGLICVDGEGDAGTGVCARLCYADSDCAAPASCEELLTLSGTPETPTLCVTLPACDLFAQDCSAAGAACYIGRSRPSCYPEGSVAMGGVCRRSSDCVKGAACAQDGQGQMTCRPLCTTDGSHPCATGSCAAAQSPAPEGVGVCL